MLTAEELATRIQNYNPKSNFEMIVNAHKYGQIKHEGQFRKSGEKYFSHPVAVAEILADQQLDDATIITALLHDTIEDTSSNKDEITKQFTSEIAD